MITVAVPCLVDGIPHDYGHFRTGSSAFAERSQLCQWPLSLPLPNGRSRSSFQGRARNIRGMVSSVSMFILSNIVQVELGESLLARTEALGPYPSIFGVLHLPLTSLAATFRELGPPDLCHVVKGTGRAGQRDVSPNIDAALRDGV